ncbi:MAG: DedA family protein [Rhizobacter sp.]|nr:DedA family protein [Bacteriovorax sp.]
MFEPLLQISSDPLLFFQFFGYWGLAAILFAEVGLFAFFLPGDSLLFTLGLMSYKSGIDIKVLIPVLLAATILGDHFSYFLGRKFADFTRRNLGKIFLEEKHLEMAHNFYLKHGGKTILFCKFIAFVRTFAPFIAGTSKMKYWRFTLYEVSGAILWVGGIVGGSHYLGKKVDFDMAAYFHYFVILLIFLLLSPFFLKYFKNKR